LAEKISARLTASEGRKFGLTVGPAFLVLGALLFWRGRLLGAQITGALGAGLLIASLVAPAALDPVRRVWMRLALAISKVTVPIFMGIVYFLVISVIGLLRRVFGNNAIKRPPSSTSYWEPHKAAGDKKQALEHQY
jgi:hypothetical protein